LRNLTKPNLSQLKDIVYDFRADRPEFDYPNLNFSPTNKPKSAWLYLYKDIQKSERGKLSIWWNNYKQTSKNVIKPKSKR